MILQNNFMCVRYVSFTQATDMVYCNNKVDGDETFYDFIPSMCAS